MKYFALVALLSAILITSCSEDQNKKVQAEREHAQGVNDSIVQAIYDQWNYILDEQATNTKNQTNDWQIWQSFIQEIKQKPSKSISGYVAKVDNLNRISDEMLKSIPPNLDHPQITARLNNLNANIKYLSNFISLQNIPVSKIKNIQLYIISDINAINKQIDERVRITNLPTEKGEQDLIKQLIDTTRRANFDFENQIKHNYHEPKLNRERTTGERATEVAPQMQTSPDTNVQEI